MSRKSLGVLALTLAFSTTLMAQSEPFLGIREIDLERTSNYLMQTQMIINVHRRCELFEVFDDDHELRSEFCCERRKTWSLSNARASSV